MGRRGRGTDLRSRHHNTVQPAQSACVRKKQKKKKQTRRHARREGKTQMLENKLRESIVILQRSYPILSRSERVHEQARREMKENTTRTIVIAGMRALTPNWSTNCAIVNVMRRTLECSVEISCGAIAGVLDEGGMDGCVGRREREPREIAHSKDQDKACQARVSCQKLSHRITVTYAFAVSAARPTERCMIPRMRRRSID